MIEKIDALEVFQLNLVRTNMLIQAVEKIRGYNNIYQSQMYQKSLEFGDIVKEVQLKELLAIENSCTEHAIISLATLWESYLKALLVQLLSQYEEYFIDQQIKYQQSLILLCRESFLNGPQEIERKLNLRNRFDYYNFIKKYNIPFLDKKEYDLIEYIFILRNSFIHGSGIQDKKRESFLKGMEPSLGRLYISTQSKQMRTKVKRMVPKVHERVFQYMSSK